LSEFYDDVFSSPNSAR